MADAQETQIKDKVGCFFNCKLYESFFWNEHFESDYLKVIESDGGIETIPVDKKDEVMNIMNIIENRSVVGGNLVGSEIAFEKCR